MGNIIREQKEEPEFINKKIRPPTLLDSLQIEIEDMIMDYKEQIEIGEEEFIELEHRKIIYRRSKKFNKEVRDIMYRTLKIRKVDRKVIYITIK